MLKILGMVMAVAIGTAGLPAHADAPDLLHAFDYSDVLKLEALAKQDPDPQLRQVAQIMALTVRRKDAETIQAMTSLKAETLAPRMACLLMLNSAMLYERQNAHQKVSDSVKSAIGFDDHCVGDSIRRTMTLHKALIGVPEMTIEPVVPGSLPVRRDIANRPHVTVSVNGVERDMILDTGASFPTVSASTARQIKLRILRGAGSTASATKTELSARLGVARTLHFGGATLNNVVFLVLPDEATAAKEYDGFRGSDAILGLTVLLKLGRIEFHRSGSEDRIDYGHRSGEKTGSANMIFHWLQPYALATANGKWPVRVFLDTGAQDSWLTPLATNEYPELGEAATAAIATYSGVGGVYEDKAASVIPRLDLTINNSTVHFENIVASSPAGDAYHVLLGQGAFTSVSKVIIDFDAMYFDLED